MEIDQWSSLARHVECHRTETFDSGMEAPNHEGNVSTRHQMTVSLSINSSMSRGVKAKLIS